MINIFFKIIVNNIYIILLLLPLFLLPSLPLPFSNSLCEHLSLAITPSGLLLQWLSLPPSILWIIVILLHNCGCCAWLAVGWQPILVVGCSSDCSQGSVSFTSSRGVCCNPVLDACWHTAGAGSHKSPAPLGCGRHVDSGILILVQVLGDNQTLEEHTDAGEHIHTHPRGFTVWFQERYWSIFYSIHILNQERKERFTSQNDHKARKQSSVWYGFNKCNSEWFESINIQPISGGGNMKNRHNIWMSFTD